MISIFTIGSVRIKQNHMKLIRFALPDAIETWLLATLTKKTIDIKDNDDCKAANEK
jgi:hypothetical protein